MKNYCDDSLILAFARPVSSVMARDGLGLQWNARQRLSKLPTAAWYSETVYEAE